MSDKVQDIILHEVRLNRKEIHDLREDVVSLKVKFGIIAIVFGFVGSLARPIMMGLFK